MISLFKHCRAKAVSTKSKMRNDKFAPAFTLTPPEKFSARIKLPASKSISNRALLINALAGNMELPNNLSDSDDTRVMLHALDRPLPSLKGRELERIFIGAAGTAMRFLTAYLSVTPGEYVITGTERMCHRPIAILVDALRQLGASITYEGDEGFPPLHIVGRDNLEGGCLTVPGDVSSQYISALLMIAPTLKNGLRLTLTGQIASRPYLDMTIAMMRDFGAKVEWDGENVIEVKPGSYQCRTYHIESDWSAASYWYEMVALSRNANAEVDLLGLHRDSIQGDSRVWHLFAELGVETQFYTEPDGMEVTRLRKGGKMTSHFSCDFTHQPDLAQTFAVTCFMLGVPFRLSGLQSLRIKETDRIAALVKELGKIGDAPTPIKTPSNSSLGEELISSPLRGGWEGSLEGLLNFDTYEDHRMAMSLAPVCLRTGGPIQINNPQVVSKSYPGFWEDLRIAGFALNDK